MSGFANNLAAINAAKKQTKAMGHAATDWKNFFKLEKLEGQWFVQHLQIENEPGFKELTQGIKEAFEEARAAGPIIAEDKTDEVAEAAAQADRIADQLQTNEQLPNGKIWVHKSSILKPTKRVWDIADEMVKAAAEAGKPAPTRKEVQDECVRRGIASGTARTQYQAWKKACDDSRSNAANAAALSAKLNGRS